jgi:F0F1-type ATP synthase gamma subunit
MVKHITNPIIIAISFVSAAKIVKTEQSAKQIVIYFLFFSLIRHNVTLSGN